MCLLALVLPDAVIIILVCPQSVSTVSPNLATFRLLALVLPDAVIIFPVVSIGDGCDECEQVPWVVLPVDQSMLLSVDKQVLYTNQQAGSLRLNM